MLVLKAGYGGFFELRSGGEIVRVYVLDATPSGVRLGFEAPSTTRIVRDRILFRQLSCLEETHARS